MRSLIILTKILSVWFAFVEPFRFLRVANEERCRDDHAAVAGEIEEEGEEAVY